MVTEPTMISCTRCCLHSSVRTVNLVVNLCGVGMIIYSLWLLRTWREGVVELGSASALPRPWFIYTCLGDGIVVCLSMVSGNMVVNSMSGSNLSVYILSVCSILCIQVGVVVTVLFKMDWKDTIFKYIEEQDQKFASFLIFHLSVCRVLVIMIIAAQISAVMVVIILWATGPEPRSHCRSSDTPSFRQSFLVGPDSAINFNGERLIHSSDQPEV